MDHIVADFAESNFLKKKKLISVKQDFNID